MDTSIVELVTQVGFPIAACVALFFLYDRSLKGFTETLTEMKAMLNELSRVIVSLDQKITGKREEVE